MNTQEQLDIFRKALNKSRDDLDIANSKKDTIVNQELEINREIQNLGNLIDALEILLGDTTAVDVFKRNKRKNGR